MPVSIRTDPSPVTALLEPFGYAEIAWSTLSFGVGFSVRLLLNITQAQLPFASAADMRAWMHTRAAEALNQLEASGYPVSASTVTIEGDPVKCELWIEVGPR